jgi:hypothetical protein
MTLQNDEQKVVAADNKAIAWVKANPAKVVIIGVALAILLAVKLL